MTLRIGLVGRGRWGKIIASTLANLPDVELLEIRHKEAQPTGLDGVIIANKSSAHAGVALPFVNAGIPTFIEKPMTTTVADAENIARAAKHSGAKVFVGHIYLFNPAFERLVEMLPSIGSIRHVLFEGANDTSREDFSVLWDWLPHGLSMAQRVFGHMPSHARAWVLDGSSKPGAAVARFQFGELSFTALVSWQSSRPCKSLSIAGTKGKLVLDDTADRKLAFYAHNDEPEYPEYGRESPLTRELRAFLALIRGEDFPAVNAQSAVNIIKAIDAAERSLRLGGDEVAI